MSAGSEFQTVGAMYPKERSPKVFRFVFGILSSLSVEERRERDGLYVQRQEDRYGGRVPSK